MYVAIEHGFAIRCTVLFVNIIVLISAWYYKCTYIVCMCACFASRVLHACVCTCVHACLSVCVFHAHIHGFIIIVIYIEKINYSQQ